MAIYGCFFAKQVLSVNEGFFLLPSKKRKIPEWKVCRLHSINSKGAMLVIWRESRWYFLTFDPMVDFLKKPQELGQNFCRKSRSLKMGETCPCQLWNWFESNGPTSYWDLRGRPCSKDWGAANRWSDDQWLHWHQSVVGQEQNCLELGLRGQRCRGGSLFCWYNINWASLNDNANNWNLCSNKSCRTSIVMECLLKSGNPEQSGKEFTKKELWATQQDCLVA